MRFSLITSIVLSAILCALLPCHSEGAETPDAVDCLLHVYAVKESAVRGLPEVTVDDAAVAQDRFGKLVASDNAKSLSSPRLLAFSGKDATFLLGGQIPLTVSSADGTKGIAYRDYGLNATCTPTISADGSITAELEAKYGRPIADAPVSASESFILTAFVPRPPEALILRTRFPDQASAKDGEFFEWAKDFPISVIVVTLAHHVFAPATASPSPTSSAAI